MSKRFSGFANSTRHTFSMLNKLRSWLVDGRGLGVLENPAFVFRISSHANIHKIFKTRSHAIGMKKKEKKEEEEEERNQSTAITNNMDFVR